MCCFTGRVEGVQGTQIFARRSTPGRQLLAYQMQLRSAEPVAMVLPLPTPPRSAGDAVRFISLEHDPGFFGRLADAFSPSFGRSGAVALGLEVHQVGKFIASFVPSLADLARLDPQFRMPPGTLDRIAAIAGWGFAVFQLAPAVQLSEVHPMAFEFPTREPDRLFFPTLHVHDGAVHDTAWFDHVLWTQGAGERFETMQVPLGKAIHPYMLAMSQGLLVAELPLSRREIRGDQPNADTWV